MGLVMASALLSSCVSGSISGSDSSISETSIPSSSVSSSYTEDSEGFFVLEDGFFSNRTDPNDTKEKSQIKIPPLKTDVGLYKKIKLYGAGEAIPLFNVKTNVSHRFNGEAPDRIDSAVASFSLKGKVTLKLQTSFLLRDKAVIRPLERKVPVSFDDQRRVISFTISSPGQYTLELAQYVVLHLFVDDLENEASSVGATYVFEAGLHNHSNDDRIPSNGLITLHSNDKVYLAPGAIVQAGFKANGSNNITIAGTGYIDGSAFDRSVERNTHTLPIDFSYCTNLSFGGFSVLDPAGWCFNLYFCKEVLIENCKVISSRANGDGISLQSCSEVDVASCFVRSWDDSLVVKNYPYYSNKSIEGSTNAINFSNCLIWTDLAQSMEIGYETVGEKMEDISFSDITILHNFHKACLSIHNANNANIKNVTFQDITIEDAEEGYGDGNNLLLDFAITFNSLWSTNHKTTSLGTVDGVKVDNVKVIEARDGLKVSVKGTKETRQAYPNVDHSLTNIEISDFSVCGSLLTASSDSLVTSLAEVGISSSGSPITGAQLTANDVSAFGSNIEAI